MLVIHIKKSVFRGNRPSACMYVAKDVSLRVLEVCVYYDVLFTFSKGTDQNMQICEHVCVLSFACMVLTFFAMTRLRSLFVTL